MFNLRLLTSQTRINKLRYILLHTLPPKHFPQVLIHFSSTGMNTQTTSMPFLKNSLPQIHNIRDTNSITTSQNAILVNPEITTFTLVNQCNNVNQFQIRFVTFSNLIQNATCKF